MKWMHRALCAQVDPELFFPDAGINAGAAFKVCKSCEVSQECLDFALKNRITDGIWGGLPPRRRRAVTPPRDTTICAQGHPKTPENRTGNGRCKPCSKAYDERKRRERENERGYRT